MTENYYINQILISLCSIVICLIQKTLGPVLVSKNWSGLVLNNWIIELTWILSLSCLVLKSTGKKQAFVQNQSLSAMALSFLVHIHILHIDYRPGTFWAAGKIQTGLGLTKLIFYSVDSFYINIYCSELLLLKHYEEDKPSNCIRWHSQGMPAGEKASYCWPQDKLVMIWRMIPSTSLRQDIWRV